MGGFGVGPFVWKGLVVLVLVSGAMLGTTTAAFATQPPIAAYSFDAGEGTTLEDVSGEHDGAIEGAQWTKGKFGNALAFNGVSTEKVTIADSNDLDLTDELTLEAWVRPTEAIEWSQVVTKVRGTSFSYQMVAQSNHNAPTGYLASSAKNWGVDGGTTPLPAKTWSHIAFTSDGGRIRFYVNGKLMGSDSMQVAAEPSTGALVIGGGLFKGKIDEVRIYDRALDEGEVTADKGAALPNPPTAVTGEAEVLSPNEAVFLGTVDPSETETRYRFEYGPTTAYGQMVPATEEEVLYEDTAQEAEEAVAYLQPSTTYHYRLVAANQAGTAVGEDKTLTTPPSEITPEQEQLDREQEENYTASISTVAPDFIGLNFRGLQEQTNADMEKVAATGASMYRISLEDLTHFSVDRSLYDKVFRNAAANHLKVLFVMGSRHLTAKQSGLATWAERIVRRYGKANAGEAGSLWESKSAPYAPTYWEVWNEPNIGLNSLSPPPAQPEDAGKLPANKRPGNVDPQRFGDYLEAISKAIRNVEPEATVIVGGLLSVGTSLKGGAAEKTGKEDEINPQKFLRQMGHSSAYQAVGFHPYAFKANNGEAPTNGTQVNQVRIKIRSAISKLRHTLNHLNNGKEKKIWITEVGWPVGVGDEAHPSVTPEIQAELVTSVFSTIKQRAKSWWNIANVFYFNYADSPDQPAWDYHTGLLDAQMNPRPAYKAFKQQTK